MSLSQVLANTFGRESLLLHPAALLPAALIAVIAAWAFHSRRPSSKVAIAVASATPIQLRDPDPCVGFDLASAKTRDHVYANKVRPA